MASIITKITDWLGIERPKHRRKRIERMIEEIYANNSLDRINHLMQCNLSTFALHQRTFLPFKGIHKGRDIVIYATGPSATRYQPIEGAIHIGVNRAFEVSPVDLDYIFLQDFSGKTPDYIESLNIYNEGRCQKFYGLTNEWIDDPNRVVPESIAARCDNALRYRTDWADVPYFTSRFAYDISTQPLGCFGTIVFPALQFALWTNPRRIYLVGCDCTTDGYSRGGGERNFLIPDQVVEAYHKFKIFANKYYPDTEIVSVNPVGLRGLFEDIEMR